MSDLTIQEIKGLKRETEHKIEQLLAQFQDNAGLDIASIDLQTASERQLDGFRMSVIIVHMQVELP